MRSRGWMALGAFLFTGCATSDLRHGVGSDDATAPPARESVARVFPRLARKEATASTPMADEAPEAIRPDVAGDEARSPKMVEAPARPVASTTLVSQSSKIEAPVATTTPNLTVTVAVTGLALREAAPQPAVPTSSSTRPQATLVADSPESPKPASVAAPSPAPALAASPPVVEVAPEIATRPFPARPKIGRPVAKVGDEVITLPELTEAVKARLAQLGPEASPTRREIIAVARSTLKAMIVASLVTQEATEKLGGPDRVEAAKARIDRAWAAEEWPATLRRERVADEAELRAKLGKALNSPESLRDQFLVRSLAGEVMRLDGPVVDFDAYLDVLRRRRPITSIMSPAELSIAGRKAALSSAGADR